ncbi:MAG: type II toxin-antitoxin system VapC family toxin [Nocardioides sp.]
MLVVDASVIAPVVADGGPDGDLLRQHIAGHALGAPDLMRIEVVSVIRRHAARGSLSHQEADHAIDDLLDLPITTYPTAALLRRCWELRANLTSYDACYVALAEALDCSLLTADRRLANAPGARCDVLVI